MPRKKQRTSVVSPFGGNQGSIIVAPRNKLVGKGIGTSAWRLSDTASGKASRPVIRTREQSMADHPAGKGKGFTLAEFRKIQASKEIAENKRLEAERELEHTRQVREHLRLVGDSDS